MSAKGDIDIIFAMRSSRKTNGVDGACRVALSTGRTAFGSVGVFS
jgi:hypothetical protein